MPLERRELPDPEPGPGEVLVRVRACGVCRTDLHIADGDLPEHRLPLVPGHQVAGEVVAAGEGAERLPPGARVGIPWLAWTCGECRYCTTGRENLCERGHFTGYDRDGGYAELAVADERYCLPLPEQYSDVEVAPLLCAGLIGLRALRACGDPAEVGLYGFGSSAHIVCQIAAHEGRRVFALTRPGDAGGQAFARELGAQWAGGSDEGPPEPIEAAIVFAPAGELMTAALRAVAPGGTVVSAGIHMTDIPSFRYADLWGERSMRSVANLTRADGAEMMRVAPEAGVRTHVERYALEEAGTALEALRRGNLKGSAVLTAFD